jgi:RNA polymerase sigma factor (sigma-70 family)
MNRSDEKEYWEFIWDKFRAGDRRAFELIYTEYVDALFSYGNRMTHHHALVEDAIQDAFLAIYTNGGRLRKPESLEFYLYKTLRRIIIKKLKEKYSFTHPDHFAEQFDLKFPLEESSAEELEEHLALLQKELGALDSKKRELLFLKFNSGLTYNEIGAMLECKPDTVKKQVLRILSMLNGKIKKPVTGLFVLFRKV